MNTPSHWLMTAAFAKTLPRLSIPKWAVWIGAIAPDLPLWLLSIGGVVYYRVLKGWSSEATLNHMFDVLFFTDPLWVISHNFLHAPLVLVMGLAIVGSLYKRKHRWARWLVWFLLACLLHTTVDILTHTNDGPLLFFPFDLQTRFNSPISYWDERYHADKFQWFELGLNVMCGLYLTKPKLLQWWYRRK